MDWDWDRDMAVRRLLEAAERGDAVRVFTLLDSGLNVNSGDLINQTALMSATQGCHVKLIRALLERGADLEVENSMGYTALTYALARSGDWPGWKSAELDRRPLDLLRAAGAKHRLFEAVLLNDLNLARLRLDEGASPDSGEWRYDGPMLMIAARLGHLAIVDLLLDRGANIEALDDLNQTALVEAVHCDQVTVVRRLLERGADANGKHASRSALTDALSRGQGQIAVLLLTKGAQWSPVDALILTNMPLLATLLDEAVRVRTEELAVDPIEDDLDEDDPATKWIRMSAVDRLGDRDGRLALQAAAMGNVEAIGLLLDRGASLLLVGIDDHSLLAEAARHGRLEVARTLLDRGADLHAVGEDGLTPLAWAIQQNQSPAAELLRQAGATH